MSEVKWIKITTDMFDNRKIKAIRKLPEGNNTILIWVMLLSLAGRCNASGMIFLTENIPYTNKMLADELDFEESVICIALNTLEKFGMIARDENLFISVNNWSEYQSVDGMERIREQNRLRNIEYRKRKKEGKNDITHDITMMDSSISYSYSLSNSNILNLNYLLDKYSSDYKYIIDNKELIDAVREWMEYKDQRKPKTSNQYTEKGMKGFLKKVIIKSETFGPELVAQAINDSISSTYQGVVWDWIDKNVKKPRQRPQPALCPASYQANKLAPQAEEEEEIQDNDKEYIDFGGMTNEEYAEFIRIQTRRCL